MPNNNPEKNQTKWCLSAISAFATFSTAIFSACALWAAWNLNETVQNHSGQIQILQNQLTSVHSRLSLDPPGFASDDDEGSVIRHRVKRDFNGMLDNCGCPPGPKGEPGDRGKRGKRGKGGKGRPGHPGVPGTEGTNGFPGPIGLDGPPGDPGPRGDKGEKGAVGSPGYEILNKDQADALGYSITKEEILMLKGEPGSPGPTGPAGPQGENGLPGYDGLQGRAGEPGLRGDAGLPGDPGVPGSPGPSGPKGDRGTMSSVGMGVGGDFPTAIIEGPPGSPGPRGDDGLNGKPGKPGNPGKQGKRGKPGRDGNSLGGTKGEPGNTGLKGEIGSSGNNGIDGIPGAKGDKGDNGLKGLDGERGKRGKKGDKGDAGEAGPPGLDAPCPLGPDGLPLAGCGWRKANPDASVPESGTGIAGSTGTGYSRPGSTSTGVGGYKGDKKSIYGTVESDSNYGSVDTNYFSSNNYGSPSYYSPPGGGSPSSSYNSWDAIEANENNYEDEYNTETPVWTNSPWDPYNKDSSSDETYAYGDVKYSNNNNDNSDDSNDYYTQKQNNQW